MASINSGHLDPCDIEEARHFANGFSIGYHIVPTILDWLITKGFKCKLQSLAPQATVFLYNERNLVSGYNYGQTTTLSKRKTKRIIIDHTQVKKVITNTSITNSAVSLDEYYGAFGRIKGKKKGVHVNWIPKFAIKFDILPDYSWSVHLRYWASLRPILGFTAAVLTDGISAAVGTATYAIHVSEMRDFVNTVWAMLYSFSNHANPRVQINYSEFNYLQQHRDSIQQHQQQQQLQQQHANRVSNSSSTRSVGVQSYSGNNVVSVDSTVKTHTQTNPITASSRLLASNTTANSYHHNRSVNNSHPNSQEAYQSSNQQYSKSTHTTSKNIPPPIKSDTVSTSSSSNSDDLIDWFSPVPVVNSFPKQNPVNLNQQRTYDPNYNPWATTTVTTTTSTSNMNGELIQIPTYNQSIQPTPAFVHPPPPPVNSFPNTSDLINKYFADINQNQYPQPYPQIINDSETTTTVYGDEFANLPPPPPPSTLPPPPNFFNINNNYSSPPQPNEFENDAASMMKLDNQFNDTNLNAPFNSDNLNLENQDEMKLRELRNNNPSYSTNNNLQPTFKQPPPPPTARNTANKGKNPAKTSDIPLYIKYGYGHAIPTELVMKKSESKNV